MPFLYALFVLLKYSFLLIFFSFENTYTIQDKTDSFVYSLQQLVDEQS